MSSHRAKRRAVSHRLRAALAGALVALIAAALCPGCRKGESPGSSPAPEAGATGRAATETDPAGRAVRAIANAKIRRATRNVIAGLFERAPGLSSQT